MSLFKTIGAGIRTASRAFEKIEAAAERGVSRVGRTIQRATEKVGRVGEVFAKGVQRARTRLTQWRGKVTRAVTEGAGQVRQFIEKGVEKGVEKAEKAGRAVGREIETRVRNFLDPPDVRQGPPSKYGDAKGLFSVNSMKEVIGLQVKGAGDPKLNQLMHELGNDPKEPRLTEVLNEIADIRGVPRGEFREQYDKFIAIRNESHQIGRANGEDPPGKLSEFHEDFMGSTPQLRYGSVVGQAFGIDPVFGALLNPTGGLVGPGNVAVRLDDDDPIGYHGIVHDAAGYLFNYHNIGPGYDYLKMERRVGVDTGNPLAGQVSGIAFWRNLVQQKGVEDVLGSAGDLIRSGLAARSATSGPGIDVPGLARAIGGAREAGLGLLDGLGDLARHTGLLGGPGGLGYTFASVGKTIGNGVTNLLEGWLTRSFASAP
jgi:hypothetical protein